MEKGKVNQKLVLTPMLYTRKLTKSGSTRYLSVGTILPSEWDYVKVLVIEQTVYGYTLRIEPIR